MLRINKTLYTLIIIFSISMLFLFLGVTNIFAATINFSPVSSSYNVGDTVRAKIIINSDVSVNAVSSKVLFPTNLLTLSSISKSGSIVNLWAQEPSFSNSNGTASMEGVILNGYIGSGGNIVTLIFNAKKEGTAEIKFSNASILANDGNGTEVITSKNSSFIIIAKAIEKPKENLKEDKVTPIENIIEKAKEAVVTVREVEQVNNLPDYSLVIILMLVIILLLILIIIYGIYYLNKIRKYLKKKLMRTEKDISDKFDLLEKDIYKEAIVSEKLKKSEKLDESEITTLVDFKQDIKNIKKDILEDIKDIENDN